MARQDYVARFEHSVLVQLIRAFYSNNFTEEVNNIPHETLKEDFTDIKYSKENLETIQKERCVADMGFLVNCQDRSDLKSYAQQALDRQQIEVPVLSISCHSCNKCSSGEYFVTPMCQGCLARPCTNCPFGAIEFVNGKSHINQEKCKKCGICAKSCPYGAIHKTVMPCVAVCPVGAIQKTSTGEATILPEKCIACGQCLRVCPFGAVMTRSEIIDVLKAIKIGKKVIAMLAPAIMGQFNGSSVGQTLMAFKKAGFSDAVEVAIGADITTCNEAKELAERLNGGASFMTTSCCPAYYNAVRKHIPELQEFVSHTLSPMQYTARLLKEQDPTCVTVFIGPCMAKREEGYNDPYTDYVLNNKEIEALFEVLNIVPNQCEELPHEESSKQGRGFPLSGGVAAAVKSLEKCEVCPVAINGLNKDAIKQLQTYAKNKQADGNLVEVMACMGGCVAGPGVAAPVKKATKEVLDIMDKSPDLKCD